MPHRRKATDVEDMRCILKSISKQSLYAVTFHEQNVSVFYDAQLRVGSLQKATLSQECRKKVQRPHDDDHHCHNCNTRIKPRMYSSSVLECCRFSVFVFIIIHIFTLTLKSVAGEMGSRVAHCFEDFTIGDEMVAVWKGEHIWWMGEVTHVWDMQFVSSFSLLSSFL